MAFDYIRRVWTARQGTNLNKFSKSGETASSVILANTPDLISVEGTPFTAGAMNNIENGIEDTRSIAYLSELFKDTVDAPFDIVTDGTYLYYLAGTSAKLYKMSIATKAVTELATVANAQSLCLNSGILYIVYNDNTSHGYTTYNVNTSDLTYFYTITGATLNYAVGVVCDGSYLYVVAGNTYNSIIRINLSTHVGELWDYVSGATYHNSIAYDGTYLYVMDNLKRITRIKVSDKSHTTLTPALPSGAYVYRCTVVDGVYGYILSWGSNTTKTIYKTSITDGTIVDRWSIGDTGAYGLCKNDVEFYFTDLYGDTINRIYQSTEFISPSTILQQSITSANVTITEDRFGNILLFGTLTGNRELILPSAVRTYKIINNCTGAHYVHVKSAAGTGVYTAPGDIWDTYCDGTDIKPIRLLNAGNSITMATLTFSYANVLDIIPISSGTFTNNTLAEISGNAFVPKNTGLVNITGYVIPSVAQTGINFWTYEDGAQLTISDRNTVNTASAAIQGNFNFIFKAVTGKSYTIRMVTTNADSAVQLIFFRITKL